MNKFMQQIKGQTLIEVLVTILIIAVGVIALIRFQHYLGYENSLTHQTSNANNLAMEQVETLRDFQTTYVTSGYDAYANISSGSQTTTLGNTTYTVTWTVSSYSAPSYKNIDVTVSWTDIRGTSKSVRMITDVADIEPYTSASIM